MNNFLMISGIGLVIFMAYWIYQMNKSVYKVPDKFPLEWQKMLQTHVHFYQNLLDRDKKIFENKVRSFLTQVRITGIRTEVTDLDRLLVASSAAITLFSFPSWKYRYLQEVLLYPASFDRNFSMENPTDKKNVAIHEFVHILDKQDGEIDGIPGTLNDKEYAKPWLQLMHMEMGRIKTGKSDIDAYAGTSEEEFLAVASEYFFERPKLFQTNHPHLYKILKKVYHQDMVSRLQTPFLKSKRIGRNSHCPCGSGEKYKNCCLNE